jgi:hypothetical protein
MSKFSDLGYSEQTCVYILFPNMFNPRKVYYLDKDKSNEPTHGFLIGYGGKFEDKDNGSIFECAKRELKQELPILSLHESSNLLQQGTLIRHDKKRVIYMLKLFSDQMLPEGYRTQNEGVGTYRPIDFFRTNPEYFLPADRLFLETLLFSDNPFETTIDEKGKVEHLIKSLG